MRALAKGVLWKLSAGILLVVFLFTGTGFVAGESDPYPSQGTGASGTDEMQITQGDEQGIDMAELSDRFAGASGDILDLAGRIAHGESPTSEELAALGPDRLRQEYSRTAPENIAPEFGHSLLREAVISRNLPAASALIAAGADPFFNENELAYLAVRMANRTAESVWWPDYSTGASFLRLWLQAGGDPNAANRYYGHSGNLLVSADPMNLEGILMLLEAGTDPWYSKQVVLNGVPREQRHDNFFEILANVAITSSELNFRIAEAGLYRGGSADQHRTLLDRFDMGLRNVLIGGSGPRFLREVWGLQMALGRILPALGLEPTSPMQEILSVPVPVEFAGFWLKPGELRSPQDGSHALRDDNQWGSARWDE